MIRNTGSLLWQKSTLMSCLVAASIRFVFWSLCEVITGLHIYFLFYTAIEI